MKGRFMDFVWNRLVLATPYIIPIGAGYTQVRTQYRLYGTPVLYNCALESTLVGDTLFPTHCFSVLVLIWPSCGQNKIKLKLIIQVCSVRLRFREVCECHDCDRIPQCLGCSRGSPILKKVGRSHRVSMEKVWKSMCMCT